MKRIVIIISIFIGLILAAFISWGLVKTYRAEHSRDQEIFRGGSVPSPSPNGFYEGNSFTGSGKDWQGKVFNAEEQTGVNQFANGQRYKFATYEAAGLRDKDIRVLRIDYRQKGNPFWIRFIVDEITETSPDHFIGKVHLNVIPGLPFTLTYFKLSQPQP